MTFPAGSNHDLRAGLTVALVSLVVACPYAWPDGGSIPFNARVKVFEPTQRALIAWNGEEEILALSTDLRTSEPTKVLEVFPFPAEPVVTEGDVRLFRKATDLINSKLRARAKTRFGGMGGGGEGGGAAAAFEPPPARLTFHETIGAHDVSVVQALRLDGFVEWVDKYLRSQHVHNPVIPTPLSEVVEEYIRDGLTWFVFDVVSLTDKPVTKQTIQFRFRTNCLYYPLRITRTEEGETVVKLLILTTELVDFTHGMGYGLPRERLRLAHKPVTIDSIELSSLDLEMYALLGSPYTAKLRIWEIRGVLSEFEQDLVIVNPGWRLHRGRDTARQPL